MQFKSDLKSKYTCIVLVQDGLDYKPEKNFECPPPKIIKYKWNNNLGYFKNIIKYFWSFLNKEYLYYYYDVETEAVKYAERRHVEELSMKDVLVMRLLENKSLRKNPLSRRKYIMWKNGRYR